MLLNNNPDFYPTPTHLIQKMIDKINFKFITTVLEPSAGKGDILDFIRQREKSIFSTYWHYNKDFHFDIDTIEKDINLQHILRGKNYRVVHNDFLTFNTMKEYDLIIMNPPFSNGCKHLLKALEMQEKNGGQIVCLLNAETIKNPFSNDRITLQKKLTEYNANIEFLTDAFIDAERKTAVETALIYIDLPKVKKDSFIFEELRKAEEIKEAEAEESTQLIESDYLKAIVKQYQMEVRAGIKLIKEYTAMQPYIMREFGKDEESREVIQKGGCILSLGLSGEKDGLSINNFIRLVRGKYWKALFNNTDFIGLLTENLQSEFYNRIEELKDYDFSSYNIMTLKIQMMEKTVQGVEDTILSLFDELSNKHHYFDETSSNIHYYNGWKTNKAWKINKKVILPLTGYGLWQDRFEPTYYKTLRKLQDIEKCFNYLDGGLTDAVDLKESLQFAEEYGETKNIQLKYFTVTFYKKGTCHIVFNNDDLLRKFNVFGSQKKGWLPPTYGKKQYKDMTTEEKAVIKEFDGSEAEYNKVIQNQKYYLFDGKSVLMLESGI